MSSSSNRGSLRRSTSDPALAEKKPTQLWKATPLAGLQVRCECDVWYKIELCLLSLLKLVSTHHENEYKTCKSLSTFPLTDTSSTQGQPGQHQCQNERDMDHRDNLHQKSWRPCRRLPAGFPSRRWSKAERESISCIHPRQPHTRSFQNHIRKCGKDISISQEVISELLSS